MQNGGLCSPCNCSFLLTILLYLSTGPPWVACVDICSSAVLCSGHRGICFSAGCTSSPSFFSDFNVCKVVSCVLFLTPFSWVASWPFLTMFFRGTTFLAGGLNLAGWWGCWRQLEIAGTGCIGHGAAWPLLSCSPHCQHKGTHTQNKQLWEISHLFFWVVLFQIFLKNGTNRYSLCSLIHTDYIILMWVSTRRTHWN